MASYKEIVSHYESCFRAHGDSPKGVDWPNLEDLLKRYRVMLGVNRAPEQPATLLDFGCGTAMLKTFIDETPAYAQLRYSGLDVGESFVMHCRQKFPGTEFLLLDVLEHPAALPEYDYIVMNGVFTEKRGMSYDEMFRYLQEMLRVIFPKAKKGIAFNVMSKAVDWEREDLFHVPADPLIAFMTKELSRHFVIRNDYGLYEYTVYLYQQPAELPML